MKKLAKRIEQNWYKKWWHNAWLLPLWCLVTIFVGVKRRVFLARHQQNFEVPVLVIGNINVGGTGKTPLITYLVKRAQQYGLKPAIVSRGYGGSSKHYPLQVQASTSVRECGDEPKLLFQRLHCPVVVSPKRAEAVELAIGLGANIIFSDDGLQHYAMARDAELIVVDAERQFGNGWLLPIGPLREPVSRLFSADLVLQNGKNFKVRPTKLVHMLSGKILTVDKIAGRTVDAVCGIGNPERFYQTLAALDVQVKPHSFPDHHAFSSADFNFASPEKVLIMTEKDAVKCQEFAQNHWWYLAVDAVLSPRATAQVDKLLKRLVRQKRGSKK